MGHEKSGKIGVERFPPDYGKYCAPPDLMPEERAERISRNPEKFRRRLRLFALLRRHKRRRRKVSVGWRPGRRVKKKRG